MLCRRPNMRQFQSCLLTLWCVLAHIWAIGSLVNLEHFFTTRYLNC